MGVKVPRRRARVVFADEEMQVVEMYVSKDTSLRMLEEFSDLQTMAQKGDHESLMAFRDFMAANIIVEWNLEDDNGNPLPITGETLYDLPGDMVFAAAQSYMRAMVPGLTVADRNLSKPSGAGDTSAVESKAESQ